MSHREIFFEKLSLRLDSIVEGDDYKKHDEWRRKNRDKVRAQEKRAREKRKAKNGGSDPEHAAHQRKYEDRQENGGSKRCSSCGKTGGRIEDHHPGGYSSDKTKPLCAACHQKTKIPKIKKGMKKSK